MTFPRLYVKPAVRFDEPCVVGPFSLSVDALAMPVFEPLRRRPLSPLAVVALASAVLGLVAPHSAGGSFAWSLASLTVLLGLGAGVRRALRLPASLGAGPGLSLLELFALGAAAWLAASGFLLAAGLASRLPLMVLAAAGLALGAWELATVAPAPRPAGAARSLESRLGIAALVALLSGYCALALLGALVTRGNPFDDHVAYTPFLKRLLEAGNLLEPFSYRRISSYGGQTVLQALVALRGNYESSDLLDRGIFHVVSLLGLIGLMQRRRFHVGVGAVLIFFVIALPEMSINSASGWTGLAMFLAAYAMATREDLAPRLRLPLVFACCAAACTLRQNFLLPAGLFAALLLLAHLAHVAKADKAARAARADDDGLPGLAARWRAALSAERTVALAAIATAAAIIIPYAFATWRSSGSFLYPILLGHMNPIAPTTPLGMTWFEKVAMVVLNGLSAEPIRVWWVILPIMLIARDPRPTQPWRWYLVSSVIGFVYLLQGFLVSDGMTLWRYAFGYVTPLALVLVIEVGDRLPLGAAAKQRGEPDERGEPAPFRLRLPGFAIFLLWLALIAQLTDSRDKLLPRLLDLSQNLSAAKAFGVDRHRGLARSYQALQQALPAGAKVAILLDDPYYLDYSRNDFQNLDLPGFAAPSLQPSFTEPERWRRYFLDHGVRYLAFVDLRKSTYLYRRAEWVRRLFLENELWRFMAAHIVDAGDAFLQLAATTKVLYLDREQGLYALDLSSPTTGPAMTTATATAGLDAPEPVRMDRFVRGLAEREYGSEAWRLVSRHDVIFLPDGGGPSGLRMAAPSPVRDGAEGLLSALFGAPASEPPHRWLNDRTHLRVLGDGSGTQRLRLELWVDVPRLTTTPKLSLVVGGEVLGETAPDATGAVSFDVAPRCSGWCDVYIIASALGEFWLDPEKNRVLKLTSLSWNEAPAASIREANRAP